MNYKEEDQILFSSILTQNYFNDFKNGDKQIEFFINGICSSNCSYCYLKKYQQELFPIELLNFDKIIENTEKLIKWYIKNKFCCNISIFSGELFTTKIGIPILKLFYDNFKILDNQFKPKKIIIPDNMNFINFPKIIEQIQEYIDLFKSINIELIFSASIDGQECDFGRTLHNSDFYIDCFNFLNKNKFVCHPMISSQNIQYWKKNYDWWVKTAPDYITKSLMMLEVRDETWSKKSIQELIEFCDYLIDFKLQYYFNNNLRDFTKFVFQLPTNNFFCNYSPELINIHSYFNSRDEITCTFSNSLIIRVADLSLCLCHRLSYQNLILGYFNEINNELTTIQMTENSVPLLLVKAHYKHSCMPYCEKCPIQPICTGYCCGNSYENYKNILMPTLEVCEMYKCKNIFLIKKYDDLGLFDILKDFENSAIDSVTLNFILDLKNNIRKYI